MRHVDAHTLLAAQYRPDACGRRGFDDRRSRISKEGGDALPLEGVGDKVHDAHERLLLGMTEAYTNGAIYTAMAILDVPIESARDP